MGPQQAVHGFQHRLQLLLLPDLRLRHLSHIQLAARQFFCNEKDKSKMQGVRKHQRVSGPPGDPAARGPLPRLTGVEQIITEQQGADKDREPWSPELSSPSCSFEKYSRAERRRGGRGQNWRCPTWEHSRHMTWEK